MNGPPLIHRLPKDVQCIVHRYVYDHYYLTVKRQYDTVWLRGLYVWHAGLCCFVDRFRNGIMNYRSEVWYSYGHIYSIGLKYRGPVLLPACYWYSMRK